MFFKPPFFDTRASLIDDGLVFKPLMRKYQNMPAVSASHEGLLMVVVFAKFKFACLRILWVQMGKLLQYVCIV